ncbi:F-box-like domain superfamily [Sesbania bispinosa]|nr:F-box-like domain superfamily [Sesbania bispinosa]
MASCSRLEKDAEGESPNWLELPRDVTANILQRLGAVEIVTSACRVCQDRECITEKLLSFTLQ